MRLERVLENLLSNAAKYIPDSSDVQIRVQRDGNWAVLSVEGHGIGIPAADIPHIFARYRRCSNVARIPVDLDWGSLLSERSSSSAAEG